jgi:hypothetical protein
MMVLINPAAEAFWGLQRAEHVGISNAFDDATAAVVERGMRFLETLGKTVAIAYFKEKSLPDALMHRVLTESQPRRCGIDCAGHYTS